MAFRRRRSFGRGRRRGRGRVRGFRGRGRRMSSRRGIRGGIRM